MFRNQRLHPLGIALLPALLGAIIGGVMLLSAEDVSPRMLLLVVSAVSGVVSLAVSTFALNDALRRVRGNDSALLEAPWWTPFRPVLKILHGRLKQEQSKRQEVETQAAQLEASAHLQKRTVARYEAALEGVELPIMISDSSDHLVYCNARARTLLTELTGGEIESQVLREVASLHELIRDSQSRAEAVASLNRELEWTTADGRVLAWRAEARTVSARGAKLGVVMHLHDVREQRSERTRHAEFVSSVCHELKTPMSGIRAYVEMLIDGEVEPEETSEVYGFIESQIDRLTRLVNNMLNLSRIESGVIELNRRDCELSELLRKSVDVVRANADEKSIVLKSMPSGIYTPVHVDPDLFAQAIINLLSNAVKYTPDGGTITLKSSQDEDHATIEIADTGLGIPEDSLPHIFERFYRVPQNNQAAHGTGLGLALVHYIVTEVHGGTIELTSKVNEGTCFSIKIPIGHLDGPGATPKAQTAVG